MARNDCGTDGWTEADFGWCPESELDIKDLLVASRENSTAPAAQEKSGWGLRPEDLSTILKLVGARTWSLHHRAAVGGNQPIVADSYLKGSRQWRTGTFKPH